MILLASSGHPTAANRLITNHISAPQWEYITQNDPDRILKPNELVAQLNSFLVKAREQMEKFDPAKSDEDNQATITSFMSSISTLLDNSYNWFPRCNQDDYFPRPFINESKSDYIIRINNTKRKKNMTSSLRRFLICTFDINEKHGRALSLLVSKQRHKTGERVHGVKEPNLEYSLTTTGENNPVRLNPDGSMGIAQFLHAEKGANVRIKNSSFVSPDQIINRDYA